MENNTKTVKRWIAGMLAATMLSSALSVPVLAAPDTTPDTAEAIRVTAWHWSEEGALVRQEDTSGWVLTLSEGQTLPAEEDLLALLPDAVEATLSRPDTTPAPEAAASAPADAAPLTAEAENTGEADTAPEKEGPDATARPAEGADAAEGTAASAGESDAGETTGTLPLTWDTAALSYPLTAGNYTVTATLPEGYILDEKAPALAVTVELPAARPEDGETADAALPDAPAAYAAPAVQADTLPPVLDTVDPVGTTINLFDYTVNPEKKDSEFEDAANYVVYYADNDLAKGINRNHILKFTKGDSDHARGANVYEGKLRYEGIVNRVLGDDGYPHLSDQVPESWAGTRHETLQTGESLAYLFDTSKEFDSAYRTSYANVKGLLKVENGYYTYNSSKNTGTAANYAWFNPATNRFTVYDGTPDASPYFFPFNAYGTSTGNDDADHYFGMTMTTRFVQQNGGYTTGEDSRPVTYEFAGDDDVWVFIDGVLVGDVGGLHGPTSLKIEFSTGNIYVGGDADGTLYEKYRDAGKLTATRWSGSTFADNTYHTLQFFYLERGNYDSNLYLKFNMESTSESSIHNVDQDGHGKSGLTFSLYATGADYNVGGSTAVYTGTTGANGVLNMVDESGNNVKLSDLRKEAGTCFVLRETNPPAGYRSLGDVHLKFMDNPNLDILLVDQPWQSGAYAAPTVTATLPRYVYQAGDATQTRIDTQDQETLKGTFFAVVLKRYAATGNAAEDWRPVYGDAMSGWQIGADAGWDSVLQAAKANPYLFAADNTGLRATIENLPGDLTGYYYILQQNGDAQAADHAEYTVAYYYTTAASLEGATADNTRRLDTTRTAREEEIQREFSVRVYVPNVKNYLIVQGAAEDGTTALSNATFALYTESQATQQADGSYTFAGDPYDTVTTRDMDQASGDSITLPGAGIFPSDASHLLEAGVYYLKELTAPEGYEPSGRVVKVVVDSTGVYADAGTGDDGVTVLRGAGKIVRSMLQFAVPDAVNTTLTDLTATLNTLPEGETPSASANWTPTGQTMDLSYHASQVPLEYGLTVGDGNPYFVVETGWSRVTLRQNYNGGNLAHNPAGVSDAGPKTEITDDLTNLFSRSTIVRVQSDVQLCALTITKRVSAPVGGDSSRAFTITVSLTDNQGNPLGGSYPYTGDTLKETEFAGVTAPQGGTVANGTGTVSLQSGQTVTLRQIPYGSRFTVTETGADAYTASYAVTASGVSPLGEGSASGTLQGDTTVAVTNTRKTGAVCLTQNVSGSMGSYSDAFTYTLQLYDPAAGQELPISGSYAGTFTPKGGTPEPVTVTFTGGTAGQIVTDTGSRAISLQDGDALALTGLPAGAVCKATEDTDNRGYTPTVDGQAVWEAAATVPGGTTPQTIVFTNTRQTIIPTGLREENHPYLAMVGLAGLAALASAAGWVEMRRRKRREEE